MILITASIYKSDAFILPNQVIPPISTSSPPSTSKRFSKLYLTRIKDPTSLYNMDISRIISVPKNTQPAQSQSYKEFNAAASEADAMLQQMMDLYQSGHTTVRPNRETFHLVMNAYKSCVEQLQQESTYTYTLPPKRKQKLLIHMEQRLLDLHYQMLELWEEGEYYLQAQTQTQTDDDDNVDDKQTITTTKKDSETNPVSELTPTTETYNLILFILAINGKVDQVEDYMEQMRRFKIAFDMKSWEYVVQARSISVLAKSTIAEKDLKFYNKKMKECLCVMERLLNEENEHENKHEHEHEHEYEQTTASIVQAYQIITNTLARIKLSSPKSCLQSAAMYTDSIVEQMHSNLSSSILYTNPLSLQQIYTSRVLVWSRQISVKGGGRTGGQKYKAARKATDALYKFINVCQDQQRFVHQPRSHEHDTSETEGIIVPSMEPTILAFNSAISAWARCTFEVENALEQAESILSRLKQINSNNNKGDNHEDLQSIVRFNIEPDVVTYNSLMNAVAKSHSNQRHHHHHHHISGKETIEKISLFFQEMEHVNILPDAFTYSIAIDAYIQSGAHPTFTHTLLNQMEQQYKTQQKQQQQRTGTPLSLLSPNVKHYSAVMNSYAKHGLAEEAQQLLNHVEDIYRQTKDRNMKPDIICYTSVIEAWGKSQSQNRGQRALDLLHKMMSPTKSNNKDDMDDNNKDDNSSSSDNVVLPTVRTFTAVIQTLANHRVEGNAEKSFQLLGVMNDMGITPNIYTYNYVILACANAPENNNHEALFRKAAVIFKQLHSSQYLSNNTTSGGSSNINLGRPNSPTYAFFIKACTHLLKRSSKRNDLVKTAFQLCCKNGCVNKEVLYRLLRACDLEVCANLLNVDVDDVMDIDVDDLDRDWSCNAR